MASRKSPYLNMDLPEPPDDFSREEYIRNLELIDTEIGEARGGKLNLKSKILEMEAAEKEQRKEMYGGGVVSGLAVTRAGALNGTVTLGAGYLPDGTRIVKADTPYSLSAADLVYPRIDVVYIDSAGAVVVRAGVPADNPVAPVAGGPDGNHVTLAEIYVPAGATVIPTDGITDKRLVISKQAEVTRDLGKRTALSTSNKENVVAAVNEVNQQLAENAVLYNHEKLYKTAFKMFNNQTTKIVCIGDSTTASDGGVYPLQMQTVLRNIYENTNITTVNSGISGNTSTQGLARFTTDVLDHTPDAVVIMFAINDGKDSGPVTFEQYRVNITSMVEQSLENGIDVLLLSPIPTWYGDNSTRPQWNEQSNKRIKRYGDIVREIAEKYKVAFIDMYTVVNDLLRKKAVALRDIYVSDTVHFNEVGYKLLADLVVANSFDTLSLRNFKEGQAIPVPNSPYIKTDITSNSSGLFGYQEAYNHTYLKDDGTHGTFLEFNFFNDDKKRRLFLMSPKGTSGGKIKALVNGVLSSDINFNVGKDFLVDTLTEVDVDLKVGYNTVRFEAANITVVDAIGVNAFFSQFLINKKSYETAKGTARQRVVDSPIVLINSPVRFTNDNASGANNVALENKYIQTANKMLRMTLKANIASQHGFSWMGNKTNNAAVNSLCMGYTFYIDTVNRIVLFGWNTDGTVVVLQTSTNTLTAGVEHEFEITTSQSLVTISVDGVEFINASVSAFKYDVGFIGLYHRSLTSTTVTSVFKDIYYYLE